MDTKPLEKFAQAARRQLHEQVAARLDRVLTTDSAELRAKAAAIKELKQQIAHTSREAVVEKVAYTWFNRFCALRYMDVNHYTRVGTVSPIPGHTQPEILQEAKQGHIDERFARTVDARAVFGLLNGTLPSGDPQQEAYRLLLVGVCNAYHAVMPFMFETIDDYTELLMPDDLLSAGSILQRVREALTAENCQDVEVIGWLYQFYISEKKDAVMARQGAVPSADIPARTQLFTPHWIVRYMVENSLGRLWMLNHPESRLVEHMDYYITPEEEITDFLRVRSPEEIRFCDPAAGSGHILTYAFDLLYAIYEEQGYNPVDIPRLILEKNLTGIEIDPRAGALAGFALTMKARAKDARFFRRGVTPDIWVMEDVTFTPDELDAYMDAVGRDLFTQNVQDWLKQFEQATTFGSLIRPLVTDTAFIRARLDDAGFFQNLFLSHTHDKLRAVLRMTEALAPRYHVVVANPPYLGGGMNAALKDFAKDHYPNSKSDLCTMFIERNLDLVRPKGIVGMITMQSWMFLSSFEKLRAWILETQTIETMAHLGPRAFDTIGGEVVSTTAFTLQRAAHPTYKGQYFRLIDGRSETEKAQMLLDDLPTDHSQLTTNYYRASASDFKKIPRSPIVYSVSEQVRYIFDVYPALQEFGVVASGIQTSNNDYYLKRWYEVSQSQITLRADLATFPHLKGRQWLPHNKGGEFRRWYGNNEYIIKWDIEELQGDPKVQLKNMDYQLLASVAWSHTSSGTFSVRYSPEGHTFNVEGPIFIDAESVWNGMAFLASKVALFLMGLLNPTLHFLVGNVKQLPYLRERVKNPAIQSCIQISRSDWDSYERSWDFNGSPLLYQRSPEEHLADIYPIMRTDWQGDISRLQELERKNNEFFIRAYGLDNDLSPEVPLSEVTLTCNPHYRYGSARLKAREWEAFGQQFPDTAARLAEIAAALSPDTPEATRLALEQRLLDDTMREFISYAVGCMFGRYSLDKPGLVLANQGETLDDYLEKVSGQWSVGSEQAVTFMPEADNVLPVLDGDWFANDITERFKAFLKVTFGESHYAENLAFIEAAIGRDVRSYFLRDFYNDHVKTYKKRPIYWLFSSRNGSFNALVYMHRYRPDTASIVLNDYLREFRAKLTARRQHLDGISLSAAATPREKTQALKESEALDKVLHELREYEDGVLYPLAARQVEIDLDDGVKVNYGKLGKALRKI